MIFRHSPLLIFFKHNPMLTASPPQPLPPAPLLCLQCTLTPNLTCWSYWLRPSARSVSVNVCILCSGNFCQGLVSFCWSVHQGTALLSLTLTWRNVLIWLGVTLKQQQQQHRFTSFFLFLMSSQGRPVFQPSICKDRIRAFLRLHSQLTNRNTHASTRWDSLPSVNFANVLCWLGHREWEGKNGGHLHYWKCAVGAMGYAG